ncbi:SapC family protein [Marinobacter sp. F3R08]|uniref:SapC family protein n=1 Tax=Marinobacter sp. F3R08 TaxID=2841559 RepID=UPI001C0873A7|nr:SapC family protein [Marinobacter sp. F3R08]MBU2954460.1 SapC family protein [Marinobacter sp. F3R08]
MSRFVPLSKSAHRESGLVATGHQFALEQAVVPVVAEEVPHVLPTMAMAFVKSDRDDGLELAALQSLQAGVNVYVHTNGRWIGGYRPAWYRAHPFRVLVDASSRQEVVCVDEQSPAFEQRCSEKGERLFDSHGELAERGRNAVAFLKKLGEATAVTSALVKQLQDAGVIVAWDLTARNPNSEAGFEVKGLYHIDERALRSLDPEVLSALNASGALSVAYAQLLSEHRLKGLSRLYELRHQASGQSRSVDDVDLEDLFGEDDDDLSFNF